MYDEFKICGIEDNIKALYLAHTDEDNISVERDAVLGSVCFDTNGSGRLEKLGDKDPEFF